MNNKDTTKKRFFAKHAKSSAVMVSLGIHAVIFVLALSFVAVTVITKEDQVFKAKEVKRPRMQLKKLQVPVEMKKKTPKPKLRKRLVVNPKLNRNIPEIKMPEISGVKGGLAGVGNGDGGVASIGFNLPEIDFFGAKAKGEKVVFVVHFGPATIGKTPYERMTGYTIRKRLEELVDSLPRYALFNVICYWMDDAWAMHPELLQATPENKRMVSEWMEPVNPLEGKYDHCFDYRGGKRRQSSFEKAVEAATGRYPKRVEKDVPGHAPKWIYPYVVPDELTKKYLPEAERGYVHWSRAVAWAVLEQKADTIFVLSTNYIDSWGGSSGNGGQPDLILASYKQMFQDTYGRIRRDWPTINAVVLQHKQDPGKVLRTQFGPIYQGTRGDGSIIRDITDYMTEEEKELYRQYKNAKPVETLGPNNEEPESGQKKNKRKNRKSSET